MHLDNKSNLDIEYILEKFDKDSISEYRKNYCYTRMCNKYIMPVLIDSIIESHNFNDFSDENVNINLSDFRKCINMAENFGLKGIEYKYYPYIIEPQDISISLMLDQLKHEKDLIDTPELITKIKDLYNKLNFDLDKSSDDVNKSLFNNVESVAFETSMYSVNAYTTKVGNEKKGKFKIDISNAQLHEENFLNVLKDMLYKNRTYDRYERISRIINDAIKNKVDIIVMPESCTPFEWLLYISKISAKNQIAIITGVEHIKFGNTVYNLTATILSYCQGEYRFSHISFHNKVHYSPEESRNIYGYNLMLKEGNTFELFNWNDIWFSVYCCFELASITERSIFQSYLDMIVGIEWNRDTNYYSDIIGSLERDLHCYCVQVNSSNYGDSRITKPSKEKYRDIVKSKGGINETILIDKIDTYALRNFQIKEYELQKDDKELFKPTPPNFNRSIVWKKIKGQLWKDIEDRIK